MISFYCLIGVVFLVCWSTTTFAQGNSTIQHGNNTNFIGCKISMKDMNRTSNSTNCKLRLIDQSKIEEVLSKHENSTTTKTVNIGIFVVPGNKTRYLQGLELSWASEIGRTIISLARRAKDSIFTSPLFTLMLEVGIQDVDIGVQEETDGCLPPGNKGSDLIFDFLLRQLSHSDDKHGFKLCQAHNDESTDHAIFNCCRIVGNADLAVCADYSSVVVDLSVIVIIVVFLTSFFMVLPFVFEYITTYPTVEFYKTSESHMSLISIVSRVFFEGHGPAKSVFRRCVFGGLSSLMFLPNFFGHVWLMLVFIIWVSAFVLFNDSEMTNETSKQVCIKNRQKICADKREENCIKECEKECVRPRWDEKLISCFTAPFYFIFSKIRAKLCKDYSESIVEKICCSCCCECFRDLVHNLSNTLMGLIFWLITLIASAFYIILVLACLVKFSFVDLLVYFIWPRHKCAKSFQLFLIPVRFLTLVNSIFFTGMIFILALSVVVGLTLNVEYFNPFVAPVLTVVIYIWKNWRSSVETKCLQLKTSIIKICEKKAFPEGFPNTGTKATENVNKPDGCNLFYDFLCSCIETTEQELEANIDQQTNNSDTTNPNAKKSSTIKFDKYGEAMILAEFYETVRKKVLPLDHILFHFFKRLIFVGLYVFGMITVMIVARESGVSETVQVISGIAGALIPFLFDTIFADHDSSHRKSEITAIKEKLGHILKVEKLENNTISVELITRSNNELERMHERRRYSV